MSSRKAFRYFGMKIAATWSLDSSAELFWVVLRSLKKWKIISRSVQQTNIESIIAFYSCTLSTPTTLGDVICVNKLSLNLTAWNRRLIHTELIAYGSRCTEISNSACDETREDRASRSSCKLLDNTLLCCIKKSVTSPFLLASSQRAFKIHRSKRNSEMTFCECKGNYYSMAL